MVVDDLVQDDDVGFGSSLGERFQLELFESLFVGDRAVGWKHAFRVSALYLLDDVSVVVC